MGIVEYRVKALNMCYKSHFSQTGFFPTEKRWILINRRNCQKWVLFLKLKIAFYIPAHTHVKYVIISSTKLRSRV